MKKTAFMLAAAMTVMACAGCGGGQTAGQSDSSDAVTQAKVKSNGASKMCIRDRLLQCESIF